MFSGIQAVDLIISILRVTCKFILRTVLLQNQYKSKIRVKSNLRGQVRLILRSLQRNMNYGQIRKKWNKIKTQEINAHHMYKTRFVCGILGRAKKIVCTRRMKLIVHLPSLNNSRLQIKGSDTSMVLVVYPFVTTISLTF
jgi:hypothetical protein